MDYMIGVAGGMASSLAPKKKIEKKKRKV